MAELSKIEWTESTFNPWIGCTKVSPGCLHCYAESDSKRRGWAEWGKGKKRKHTAEDMWKQPLKWNREAAASQRRRRVFCASLADVFDEEVQTEWREELWQLIKNTPHLDWLLLTKRPQNFRAMLPKDWGAGWSNVCLMTSVEDQLRISRIDHLIDTPSRFRALSVEPLLGPIRFAPASLKKLDWIIVGGESGPHARPMHPQWVRNVRDQCEKAGVKFLFKQWGCWTPDSTAESKDLRNVVHFAETKTVQPTYLKEMSLEDRRQFRSSTKGGSWLFRTSKEIAGNILDGQRHKAHPFGKKIPKSEVAARLSAVERGRLRSLERTIHLGLGTFMEVGIALREIRDTQLYRESHSTFEEYVNGVLSLSRTHAYKLIDSALVVRDLSSIEDIPRLPTNEAQARELIRLKTPEERATAWLQVLETAGAEPLTAKRIRESVSPRDAAVAGDQKDRVRIGTLIGRLRGYFSGSPSEADATALLDQLEGLAFAKPH